MKSLAYPDQAMGKSKKSEGEFVRIGRNSLGKKFQLKQRRKITIKVVSEGHLLWVALFNGIADIIGRA